MSKKGIRSATEPELSPSEADATLLSLPGEEKARREDRIPLRWGKLLQATSEEDHERVVLVAELQSERTEVKVPASGVSGDEDLLRDFEQRDKGA